MERILIIGCSGSGKTTLARKLGKKLKLPVVHLDKLWWTGNWENVTREEFDARLAEELEKPRWIIDGNYNRTLPQRLKKCDTVIYLDFNRFVCLWGAMKRVIRGYGKTRPDMGGNCPERFDLGFLCWIWNYNKNNRKENYRRLRDTEGIQVFILKNRRTVRKFLEQIPCTR